MNSIESLREGCAVGADASSTARPAGPTASTGFGSPGSDSTVRRIDLNEALIRHPQATYAMRAQGTDMSAAGVGDGDVLLVDRAMTPAAGQVVIAAVDGDLVCRRLLKKDGRTYLGIEPDAHASSPASSPAHSIAPSPAPDDGQEDASLEIWGVVTTVIKPMLG